MSSQKLTIQHISDTALWVAYFRALELEQPKPLFHDYLAKNLIGDRGKKIAESMKATARYTQWSVVTRTFIIDQYIQELVRDGVDMVINLGAGLDTRPYRLSLPNNLHWIEIDYPQIIEHKETILKSEKPTVNLERISLDLSQRDERKIIFKQLATRAKKILILTEGVIPYLTEEQVATLAEDLGHEKKFHFWLAEYLSSKVYRHLKAPKRMQQMKKAPFQFFPTNWLAFFEKHGWHAKEIRYFAKESRKMQRQIPSPWWSFLIIFFMSQKNRNKLQQQSGFALFIQNKLLLPI